MTVTRRSAAKGKTSKPPKARGKDTERQVHDIAHQKEQELLGSGDMLVAGADGLPAGVDESVAAQAQRLCAVDDPVPEMTQEELERLMGTDLAQLSGGAATAIPAQEEAPTPAQQPARGRTRRPSKRKAEADADAEAAAAAIEPQAPDAEEAEEEEAEVEEEADEEYVEEPASPRPRRAKASKGKRSSRGRGAAADWDDDVYTDDDAEERVADAFTGAIKKIPKGQTRTYAQVAEASGRPHAARTVGRAIRALDLDSTRVPWHRVVSQDGSFIHTGALGLEQLERLRDEGARPHEEESVSEWAERVRAHVVGCFSYGAEAFVFLDARDERVDEFDPKKVEPFADADAAQARGFVAAADMVVEE